MTREEAIAIICKSELSVHADSIIRHLQPSVLIKAKHVPMEELPLGASRMGGIPDVPERFAWPRWTGSRLEFAGFGVTRRTKFPERNLDFIAQMNLEDLRGFSGCENLPLDGMLYFFYDTENQPWGFDPEDHLGSRVIFIEKTSKPLLRFGDPTGTLPCSLSFEEEWTIPDWETLGFNLDDGLEILDELKQEIGIKQPDCWTPTHRLLGWPEPIQGDMRLECECVSKGLYCGGSYDDPRIDVLKERAEDWRLFLQVDSDTENTGWMWGDVGRIYYWIHKDDLAARRFENVRLILQCS